jgi:hypothetical protein
MHLEAYQSKYQTGRRGFTHKRLSHCFSMGYMSEADTVRPEKGLKKAEKFCVEDEKRPVIQ